MGNDKWKKEEAVNGISIGDEETEETGNSQIEVTV
jgi:hypothetical protein